MQAWEYLIVECFAGEWRDSLGQRGTCARQPGWERSRDFGAMLNRFGTEGWELTGAPPGETHSSFTLFFKRPVTR